MSEMLTFTESQVQRLWGRDEMPSRQFLLNLGFSCDRYDECLGCGGNVEVLTHPNCRWEMHANCSDHREFFVMDDD